MQPDSYPHISPFDTMDNGDHSSYTLFHDPASSAFNSHRYRTNASSSSLGPSYPMTSDAIYQHASFQDAVSPYNTPSVNPYDMMAMNSGKVSPMNPSDPAMQHYSPTVSGKEFSSQPFGGDIHDRRLQGGSSNGYQSDYPDDYGMSLNTNTNMPFPAAPIQQFPDRLTRFPSERYSHHTAPIVSHMHSNHSTEIMRSTVPSPATPFRDTSISPYNEMQYLGNSEIRMHSVDETLSRMKLQGNPMMGPASDLQSFIR